MTKLIVAFRNSANAHENLKHVFRPREKNAEQNGNICVANTSGL